MKLFIDISDYMSSKGKFDKVDIFVHIIVPLYLMPQKCNCFAWRRKIFALLKNYQYINFFIMTLLISQWINLLANNIASNNIISECTQKEISTTQEYKTFKVSYVRKRYLD